MSRWMPIETVPMDGSPVLVWSPEPFSRRSNVQVANYSPNCAIVGNVFLFDLKGGQRPTHWTFMLAGPTQETRSATCDQPLWEHQGVATSEKCHLPEGHEGPCDYS